MSKGSCCTPSSKHCGCNDPQTSKSFERIYSGSTDSMRLLPGGSFLMGTDDSIGYPADGKGPIRSVVVDPFYIDPYAVSVSDFLNSLMPPPIKPMRKPLDIPLFFMPYSLQAANARSIYRDAPSKDWNGGTT